MRTSVFANSFELLGLRHERCEKPTCALTPKQHHELKLPVIGKVHLDVYADYVAASLYTRLYSMEVGEVAWFAVTMVSPEPSPPMQG